MRLFAERGATAVSIRDVSAAAGVSSSLVIHHFGSKRGLKEAADERAMGALEEVLAVSGDESTVDGAMESMQASLVDQLQQEPLLMPYLRRLLVDGGPAAQALFDRLLESTRGALHQWQQAGIVRPSADDDVLSAFVLVADLATILLGEQIQTALGFNPVQGEGLQRWSAALLDLYREGIFIQPPAQDRTHRGKR